jgi:hypothetical protein
MPDAYSACEDSTIFEREIVTVNPRGVSRAEEKVLGAAFVGEGVFLCDGRDGDARNDKGIYRTSV